MTTSREAIRILLCAALWLARSGSGSGQPAAPGEGEGARSWPRGWLKASGSRSTACSTRRSGRARPRPPISSRSIRATASRPPSRPKCASPSATMRSTWASRAYDSEPDKWLGYQRRRDELLGSDDRFMWTIDTFLDARSGYFFEMNPSGLMADSLIGVNGDNRAVGRHLERARPAQRDRLDDRDRDPVPHAQLQPQQRHLGHQLPAHRAPQERRQHLDGLGAQPGAAAHDQRRPRHRHPRRHGRDAASTSSRTACSRRRRRPAVATRAGGPATGIGRNAGVDLFYNPTPGLRANLTVNTDFAQTEVDQRQVNLTPLLAVLSRAARFLPRRRDVLRFRQHAAASGEVRRQPVLQPADRPERHRARRRRSTSAPRSPARWARRTSASCTSAPARTTTSGMHRRGFHGRARQAARAAGSPTSARSTRGAMRAPTASDASHTRRRRFPPGHVDVSAARRISNATGWFAARRPPRRVDAATAPSALTVDYPNDRWNGGFSMREVQRELRSRRRLRHAPRLPPLQPVARLRAASGATTATSGGSSSAATLELLDRS